VSLGHLRELRQIVLHSADNLYLDRNGHLVVAELKRGRAPRDITAQAIDCGAHASQLPWDELGRLSQQRHGQSLDQAYRDYIGADLNMSESPEHRLPVVGGELR
jgi:hypothetical protein